MSEATGEAAGGGVDSRNLALLLVTACGLIILGVLVVLGEGSSEGMWRSLEKNWYMAVSVSIQSLVVGVWLFRQGQRFLGFRALRKKMERIAEERGYSTEVGERKLLDSGSTVWRPEE